ncbi:hypothetical protein MRX96_016935 [Rhipicephalus microplus]
MMVVGMVSLGGSLAVVLMYITFVSLRCPDPKFYKCSPQLGSWPQPGDESWFFLLTRFRPGCFKWDAEAQCLWDSPAHFKELQRCRKHCHRGCPDPKFYKCSPQLGSWPQPRDESWFFLLTRFGPGCFKWDAEAQCLWDSPAHFKELQRCRKHCHRGDESWFFLLTRFGPGCFKWDAEAQCLCDSPAQFKELQRCRKHCHRGEALLASQ